MSKKSLISSLIVGLVVTIALGIYTIVSVLTGVGSGIVNKNQNLAFRVGDIIEEFDGYKEEDNTLKFQFETENVEERPIEKNEDGQYQVVSEGSFKAIVKLNKKGDTITYSVKTYNQGTGETEESPYVVANAKNLVELRDNFNALKDRLTGEDNTVEGFTVPAYLKLVGDIDLSSVDNWIPIGWMGHEYTGSIDGAGATISNLKINVTLENISDFIANCYDTVDAATYSFVDLGLFGSAKDMSIKDINIQNAEISIDESVYSAIADKTLELPESASSFARVSMGSIVGFAQNVKVLGTETRNNIKSNIEGFSFGDNGYSSGMGGVIGIGKDIEINNFNVQIKMNNSSKVVENSNIGGIIGFANNSPINKINNIDIDFEGVSWFTNKAVIGGVAGRAFNLEVDAVKVASFKVTDAATWSQVKDANIDETKELTMIAGVVGRLNTSSSNTAPSIIKNTTVENVDVFALGSRVAGVVGRLGNTNATYDESAVQDTTVKGEIQGHYVAGFAFIVNEYAKIEFTDASATAVEMNLSGLSTAGFVFFNHGVIKGASSELVEDETTRTIKTIVKVSIIGKGGELDENAQDKILAMKNLRKNATVAGFVYENSQSNVAKIPEISDFDIRVVGSNSVNYAGVATMNKSATIKDLFVNATFTSYISKDANGNNLSTSYMFAGIANTVEGGATYESIQGGEARIEGCEVILNINNGADPTLAYAGSYVGGLVSRYVGDNNEKGLILSNNVVSGEAFFNTTYHKVYFGEEEAQEVLGVFVAGGLVAAISTPDGDNADQDNAQVVAIANSSFTNNTVKNFTITADFKQESADLKAEDKMLNAEAYRYRAIGATIGLVQSTDAIDLSTTTLEKVVVKAYFNTFRYAHDTEGSGRYIYTIGGNNNHSTSVGITLSFNTNNNQNITDVSELNTEKVDYQNLENANA